MWGTGTNQTMLLRGSCGKRRLHVLIDIGSIHNFLSEQMARKLHCAITMVTSIWVEVANGQELKCDSMCKDFQWCMQQQAFKVNVYLLPLRSYDLILGIQWLKTLGTINWNFVDLTMSFNLKGVDYALCGEQIHTKG